MFSDISVSENVEVQAGTEAVLTCSVNDELEDVNILWRDEDDDALYYIDNSTDHDLNNNTIHVRSSNDTFFTCYVVDLLSNTTFSERVYLKTFGRSINRTISYFLRST